MKWFSLAFVILLLVGMLLGSSSVAYADDGEDGGIDVDITITGDNPDVGIGITGDNPDVWVNGQNLNEPTAVYNVSNNVSASPMGVRRLVKDVMFPYMDDVWARLNLTAEGLAKVIILAQSNESGIVTIFEKIGNHIPTRLDAQDERLTALESDATYQLGQIETLEAQDEAIKAYIAANTEYLRADYNRKLTMIVIPFSVVIIGLAIGLGLLWKRRRIT